MLLLAYLVTRSQGWTDAAIRVLAPQFERDSEQTLEDPRQKLAIVAKEKLLEQIKVEAASSEKVESEIAALQAAHKEAEKQAEKAARRFAKARAKAETASKVVEDLGVKPSKSDTEADGEVD